MYMLWESLLATIHVAIATAKGLPEYWLPEGAHLVRQKVANYHQEVCQPSQDDASRKVEGSNPDTGKDFHLEISVKWLLTKSLACSTVNCV